MKNIIIFVTLIFLTGCTAKHSVDNATSLQFLTPSKTYNIGVNPTKQIVFIADNQFHNIYTDPNLPGSCIADWKVSVAIRPTPLNLFAPDLFSYALQESAKDSIILHMGDALNISSTYEWKVFLKAISDSSIMHDGWYMIPGNHDAYFMGNGAGKFDAGDERGGKLEWTDAANSTGLQTGCCPIILDKPFTKDRFVKSYVEHLLSQHHIITGEKKIFMDFLAGCPVERDPCCRSFHWHSEKNNNSPLKSFQGEYFDDDELYWKSFIVQELVIPTQSQGPLTMVLMDTTNYTKRPSLRSGLLDFTDGFEKVNAGLHGAISQEQCKAIMTILQNRKNPNSSYILAGHHPFNELTKKTKKMINELSSYPGFITYISAHTHDPIEAYQSCDHKLKFPEFNIGSITDTPQRTPTACPLISKPSPQYAILKTNGDVTVMDHLADSITQKAIGFPLRTRKYYMQYKENHVFFTIADSKKNPHRKNLKLIALALYDMFNTLYPNNIKAAQAMESLEPIICDDTIAKGQVFSYVKTLKRAQEIDNELRKENEYRRLLYGAWEAIQASLAEAGCYLTKGKNPIAECPE
ncbi:MAG: metallophosphoesterase [Desulfatibacillum sp.]|nr:metallophosphoesterase [Desulfatibacillum sp.]